MAYATEDIVGTIVSVQGDFTRNGKARTNVTVQHAQGVESFATFSPDRAARAAALVQQPGVTVRISHSPDGKYKNFEDAFAPGQAPAPANPVQQGVPQYVPAPQQAAPAAAPYVMTTSKDIEIRRAVALKAAVEIVASGNDGVKTREQILEEVFSYTSAFGRYLADGPPMPLVPEETTQEPLAPGVSPAAVAEYANANGAPAPVTVGAPVAPQETPSY